MNSKRIIIATLCGLGAGFVCVAAAMVTFNVTFTPLALIFVVSSRLAIGFTIGISSLKMPWPAHGLLIGLIIGFPFPIYDLIVGMGTSIAAGAFVMSLVFGVAIEFITTVLFKAPVE